VVVDGSVVVEVVVEDATVVPTVVEVVEPEGVQAAIRTTAHSRYLAFTRVRLTI
jgi:hypothetical protein